MKKYIILLSVLFLSGCGKDPLAPRCKWDVDNKVRKESFEKCLSISADARKGRDYKTNDDEDFDEVISECGNQAYMLSLTEETMCEKEDARERGATK